MRATLAGAGLALPQLVLPSGITNQLLHYINSEVFTNVCWFVCLFPLAFLDAALAGSLQETPADDAIRAIEECQVELSAGVLFSCLLSVLREDWHW